MLRALSILSLAVACSGCSLFRSDDPPIDEPMATAGAAEDSWSLDIGHGEGSFAPLEDGAHVTKEQGPQGGYHVAIAARLEGPNVREETTPRTSVASLHSYSNADVEVEVVSGSEVVSRSVSVHSSTLNGETRVEFGSLRAYVDETLHGETTITVKVATRDKTKWASASRQVFVD